MAMPEVVSSTARAGRRGEWSKVVDLGGILFSCFRALRTGLYLFILGAYLSLLNREFTGIKAHRSLAR